MSYRDARLGPWPVLAAALAAGVLNLFAFAPFHLWPLQIATLALVFLLATRTPSALRAGLIGWAYSSGLLVAGVHWLYVSMHDYGGMPGWMAALAVVLLGTTLSVLPGLAMWGSLRLRRRYALGDAATLLLVLPAAWTLAEWTRGWIFTGFPWLSSGYAHTVGPLAGFAPLAGVYGLAWIAALVAGCLALSPRRRAMLAPAALLLAAGYALAPIDWTAPQGKPISVRLLQGNVPQEMKFDPQQLGETLQLYRSMIESQPADLIATPETALPLLSTRLPPGYLPGLAQYAQHSGSNLIIGLAMSDGPGRYANSVIGLGPEAHRYRYDKHHLVPFGEFIPIGARWFVDMMHIPLGDFTSGGLLQPPFPVRDQWVMPNICYEDLFGEEIAAQIAHAAAAGKPQPTILLNVSNIGWFGNTIAVPQHLQISQMRALETGRPMLRATNTGATAIIDPKGRIVARLAPFTRGALSASVQGYHGLTPYARYGNTPLVVLLIGLLAGACLAGVSTRHNPHGAGKNR